MPERIYSNKADWSGAPMIGMLANKEDDDTDFDGEVIEPIDIIDTCLQPIKTIEGFTREVQMVGLLFYCLMRESNEKS